MERRWDKSKPPRGPFALNRDCPQAVGLVAWYPMGGVTGPKFIADHVGKAHLTLGTQGTMTRGVVGDPVQSHIRPLESRIDHRLRDLQPVRRLCLQPVLFQSALFRAVVLAR